MRNDVPERRPSAAAVARWLSAQPAFHRYRAAWALSFAALLAAGLWVTRSRPEIGPTGAVESTFASVQRVPMPSHLLLGRPARAADLLPYAEIDGGVAVIDLGTLTSRRVIAPAPAAGAEFTSLSPDGARLAYQWRLPDDRYELRLADVRTGSTHVLLPADAANYAVPLDWTADGRTVLVLRPTAGGARQLQLVPVDGASGTVVRRFPGSTPFGASVSPDGRFVAWDDLPTTADARDVWIGDVRTGEAWPVAAHAASDAFPSWTPDGRAVYFVSTRAGSQDGWVQDLRNGRPIGEPRIVARHLGRTSPLGFGAGGRYYFNAQTSVIDAMTAPIDLATGRVGTPQRVSRRFEGASAQPAWSPDGRQLAYIGIQGPIRGDRGGHVIVVHDPRTGDERVVGQDLSIFLPSLSWSPDSRRVLVRAADATMRASMREVDVASGAVGAPLGAREIVPMGRWSPGGRTLVYLDARGLVAVDRYTGAEHVWVPHASSGVTFVQRYALAPDAGTVAYSGVIPGSESTSIRVASRGGEHHEIARSEPGERLVAQCWTPDGTEVLFTRWRAPSSAEPHALWAARRDGGRQRSLHFAVAGLTQVNGVTLDPSGTRLAYTVGDVSWQLSRLTNFLAPPPTAPRF